jgi:hypothetical protein
MDVGVGTVNELYKKDVKKKLRLDRRPRKAWSRDPAHFLLPLDWLERFGSG